jgi:hypothetical protein
VGGACKESKGKWGQKTAKLCGYAVNHCLQLEKKKKEIKIKENIHYLLSPLSLPFSAYSFT